MKIVFDTNVIISALITQGLSSRVLDICIDKHQLYISQWILDEVLEKLSKKIHIPPSEINRTKNFLNSIFNHYNPSGKCPDECRDKDDNNVLFLAQCIHADLIITRDNDLLVLKKYMKTEIISPRQFVEKYYKPE